MCRPDLAPRDGQPQPSALGRRPAAAPGLSTCLVSLRLNGGGALSSLGLCVPSCFWAVQCWVLPTAGPRAVSGQQRGPGVKGASRPVEGPVPLASWLQLGGLAQPPPLGGSSGARPPVQLRPCICAVNSLALLTLHTHCGAPARAVAASGASCRGLPESELHPAPPPCGSVFVAPRGLTLEGGSFAEAAWGDCCPQGRVGGAALAAQCWDRPLPPLRRQHTGVCSPGPGGAGAASRQVEGRATARACPAQRLQEHLALLLGALLGAAWPQGRPPLLGQAGAWEGQHTLRVAELLQGQALERKERPPSGTSSVC